MAIPTRPLAALAVSLLLAACAADPNAEGPGGTALERTELEASAAIAAEEAALAAAAEQARQAAETVARAPMLRAVTPYVVKRGEDLLDIARAHNLGFLELKAANPGVDVWIPKPGGTIALPDTHLTAIAMDEGLLINLAQMRIFRFEKGAVVESHPLGIGREGLETPLGRTHVVRKAKNPTWYPTERMRQEKPELPAAVPAGPDNPLGNRAMYLDWPLYRIHGTNIPWGVGRRVSSGCIRMYPEDVEAFYEKVSVGTPVEVVNQRLLAAWHDGRLWVEVHPTAEGWDALELDQPMPPEVLTTDMVRAITRVVPDTSLIDWAAVRRALTERRGYPVVVGASPTS